MARPTAGTALAILTVLLAALPAAHAADAGNAGVDAGHSGFSTAAPAPPLIRGWSRPDLRGGTAPPVADGASVFVDTATSDRASLVALDAATGATRWEAPSAASPLAARGGRVFASTQPQFVLGARDAGTGVAQWADDQTLFGGPVAADGVVAGADVLGVRVLDAASGALRWASRDGSGPVALDADRVYVLSGGRNDCVVRAYPRTTVLGLALQAWTTPCGVTAYGSQPLVAAAGRVYANELVLDAATGRRLHVLPGHAGLSVAPSGSAFVVRDGEISGHRPDGSQRWRTEVPGAASSSTLLAAQTLYAMTQDGVLRALDTTSGAVTWRTSTPLRGHVGMTVTDDAIVLAGLQGVVTYTAPIIRSGRALSVRLRPGRSASATARIVLRRPAAVTMSVYRATRRIARRTLRAAAGRRTIAVTLGRARVRALRGSSARSLRIVVTARDASGASQRIVKRAALRRR